MTIFKFLSYLNFKRVSVKIYLKNSYQNKLLIKNRIYKFGTGVLQTDQEELKEKRKKNTKYIKDISCSKTVISEYPPTLLNPLRRFSDYHSKKIEIIISFGVFIL